VQSIKDRPLKLPEFIGPLSLCHQTMDDQYDEFKTFTDHITGDLAHRVALAASRGEDIGGKPKRGAKKKKGS